MLWESPFVGVHRSSFSAKMLIELGTKRQFGNDANPSSGESEIRYFINPHHVYDIMYGMTLSN